MDKNNTEDFDHFVKAEIKEDPDLMNGDLKDYQGDVKVKTTTRAESAESSQRLLNGEKVKQEFQLFHLGKEVHKGDSAPTTVPTTSPKSRPVQGQTSDFTESEKEIKLSFLGILSEFPLLWRQDDPRYLDKSAKKKAREVILSKMKVKHGDDKLGPLNILSIDDLHRVYESLRAGLRRVHSDQRKKIKMGEVKGGNSIA